VTVPYISLWLAAIYEKILALPAEKLEQSLLVGTPLEELGLLLWFKGFLNYIAILFLA
jgi:hypothetical protein